MIDYILAFATDEDRDAVFPYPGEDARPPSWRYGPYTVVPGRVWIKRAVLDDDGEEVEPAVYSGRSWLLVRAPARDARIEAMPNCMLAMDPNRTGRYVQFHRFDAEEVIGNFEPQLAGDRYPTRDGGVSKAEMDGRVIE